METLDAGSRQRSVVCQYSLGRGGMLLAHLHPLVLWPIVLLTIA